MPGLKASLARRRRQSPRGPRHPWPYLLCRAYFPADGLAAGPQPGGTAAEGGRVTQVPLDAGCGARDSQGRPTTGAGRGTPLRGAGSPALNQGAFL